VRLALPQVSQIDASKLSNIAQIVGISG
jgi:hypothetical protein